MDMDFKDREVYDYEYSCPCRKAWTGSMEHVSHLVGSSCTFCGEKLQLIRSPEMKGIKKQIEADNGSYEELTEEKLKVFLKDVIESNKNSFVLYNLCIEEGIIRRDNNLNLCDNPQCDNCRDLEKAIKEEFNKNK